METTGQGAEPTSSSRRDSAFRVVAGLAEAVGQNRIEHWSQPGMVALDIDGTIAVPGTNQISDRVRASVARLLARGHHVVLASGHSLVGILPVSGELGLTESWTVASNGAVTARLDSQASHGYVLEDTQTFDAEPAVRLARTALPGVRTGTERIGWGYRVTHLFESHEVNGAQQIVRPEDLWDRPTTRLILRGFGVLDVLEPLRAAGVTVTPASPDVRETADGVTGTLGEHGAAVTLDALAWGRCRDGTTLSHRLDP